MKVRVSAIVLALLALATAGAPRENPPKIEFGRNGITVGGLKPGTHVAWMAMVRDRGHHRTVVRTMCGYGPATPNSTFAIEYEKADEARGIWTVADVETGAAVHAKSPTIVMSTHSIVVRVAPGDASVAISSAAVNVLYVRPNQGAWTYAVADGGGLDGDAETNGVVVMPLAALNRLKGNPNPPQTVEAGDVILIVDPQRLRTAAVEVQQ